MFLLSESSEKIIAIMAFRGSGKSTVMNLSYSLWSILGVLQKKCIVIISRKKSQARNHFLNFCEEIKNNELLKRELGPLEPDDVSDSAMSLLLPKMKARIFVASSRETLRGVRHGSQRPDLIILDDVDDTLTSKEDMQSTYEWFNDEILPLGDETTKIVILGNLISKDCLLMRVKEDIQSNKIKGIFKAYPIMDDHGTPLWPAKFPQEKIDELRNTIAEKKSWEKEYLLYIDDSESRKSFYDDDSLPMFKALKFPHKPYNPYPNPQTMDDYIITRPIIWDDDYLMNEHTKIMREFLNKDRFS